MYVSVPVVCSRIRETDSLSSPLFVVIMASRTLKQSCVSAQGCHDFIGYTSSVSVPSSFLHWGKPALKLGRFGGHAMPQFSSLLSFSAQAHKHTSKKLASTLSPQKNKSPCLSGHNEWRHMPQESVHTESPGLVPQIASSETPLVWLRSRSDLWIIQTAHENLYCGL